MSLPIRLLALQSTVAGRPTAAAQPRLLGVVQVAAAPAVLALVKKAKVLVGMDGVAGFCQAHGVQVDILAAVVDLAATPDYVLEAFEVVLAVVGSAVGDARHERRESALVDGVPVPAPASHIRVCEPLAGQQSPHRPVVLHVDCFMQRCCVHGGINLVHIDIRVVEEDFKDVIVMEDD